MVSIIIRGYRKNSNGMDTSEQYRIINARFCSKYKKFSMIHVYAPTYDACDEDIDQFYEKLQAVVE